MGKGEGRRRKWSGWRQLAKRENLVWEQEERGGRRVLVVRRPQTFLLQLRSSPPIHIAAYGSGKDSRDTSKWHPFRTEGEQGEVTAYAICEQRRVPCTKVQDHPQQENKVRFPTFKGFAQRAIRATVVHT